MISEQKKFIFIHIPKTGGNSITMSLKDFSSDKFLYSRHDGKNYNSVSVYNKKHKISKHDMLKVYDKNGYNLNEYFKFSVVRNPWDRISSYLHYHIKKGSPLNTMDKILNYTLNINDKKTGLYPQLEYFKNLNGDIVIDYVIKFDNLQDGFDQVCDKIGIERKKLKKINESKNSKIDYRGEFTEKQKNLIYDIYKEDIDYFGFEF